MNNIKQWVLGTVLLILTPFLLLFGMLVSFMFKFPIWVYLMYSEIWHDYKEKRK